jgi:NAD(P)-dependent dehydrogenase (short-subunit alcohol dehydrogenase family)
VPPPFFFFLNFKFVNFLQPDSNIAIVGSSGGIGSAFVRQLTLQPGNGSLLAFSRSGQPETSPGVTGLFIDITSEGSIQAAAQRAAAAGPLDLVIVASGLLHRGEKLTPEKSMRELDADKLIEVMRVNAIGPALVAKHFLPLLRRDRKTVFAALSARVGSIADNRLGGWAAYRGSKAALNMLLRTLAIEHARKRPESVVVALHPGTVATALSEPFVGKLSNERLFTPDQSAAYLLGVIDGLAPADTGGFFAWDGKAIEF